jgi:CBS-domain-containing membrane protein
MQPDTRAVTERTLTVREVISGPAVTCGPATTLSDAARLMSRHNCGCLLVTGDRSQLLGLVTDRDIALALKTRANTAGLAVRDLMTRDVEACRAEDGVDEAVQRLAAVGVRRLAVLDADRRVEGVLSIDDIVRQAGGPGLSPERVLEALKAVAGAETGKPVHP